MPRVGRLLTAPVIVTLVGAFLLVPWLGVAARGDAGATIGVAVADLVLTVGLGVVRGAAVEVGADATGTVRYRYTWLTVGLWAVSVMLRFALANAGAGLGASPAVTEGSVMLALGVALLTQNLVVLHTATRARRHPTPPPAMRRVESSPRADSGGASNNPPGRPIRVRHEPPESAEEGMQMDGATEFPASTGMVAPRSLAAAGITRYEQLAERTEREILTIHGVGPKAIRILEEELRRRGMSFREG